MRRSDYSFTHRTDIRFPDFGLVSAAHLRGGSLFYLLVTGHSRHRLSHSSTPETKPNKGNRSTSTCPSGQVIAKSNATRRYFRHRSGDWNLLGNYREAYRARHPLGVLKLQRSKGASRLGPSTRSQVSVLQEHGFGIDDRGPFRRTQEKTSWPNYWQYTYIMYTA
jgi:hypothetical protein